MSPLTHRIARRVAGLGAALMTAAGLSLAAAPAALAAPSSVDGTITVVLNAACTTPVTSCGTGAPEQAPAQDTVTVTTPPAVQGPITNPAVSTAPAPDVCPAVPTSPVVTCTATTS